MKLIKAGSRSHLDRTPGAIPARARLFETCGKPRLLRRRGASELATAPLPRRSRCFCRRSVSRRLAAPIRIGVPNLRSRFSGHRHPAGRHTLGAARSRPTSLPSAPCLWRNHAGVLAEGHCGRQEDEGLRFRNHGTRSNISRMPSRLSLRSPFREPYTIAFRCGAPFAAGAADLSDGDIWWIRILSLAQRTLAR